MDSLLHWLWSLTWQEAAWFMLAHNVAIFAVALMGGNHAVRIWAARKVAPPPPELTGLEIGLAAVNVAITGVVAFAGWLLWKAGIIRLREASFPGIVCDGAVLMLVMDFAMYWLHRLAHHPVLYRWVHHLHHRFDNPRPLTLFVLHPLENIAFGSLWLGVITVAGIAGGFSFAGMILYLGLNVAFGVCGHLGVQPFGRRLRLLTVLRHFAGSVFHARHHANEAMNFGFYTRVWDRLWGTGDRHTDPDHTN